MGLMEALLIDKLWDVQFLAAHLLIEKLLTATPSVGTVPLGAAKLNNVSPAFGQDRRTGVLWMADTLSAALLGRQFSTPGALTKSR